MKRPVLLTGVQNHAKRTVLCFIFAAAVLLPHHHATALSTVNLSTASYFATLAGSGITIAGAVNSSTITGDIGAFPTASISGLGNVVLNGVNHAGDAVTQNAKNDLLTAYTDAAGRPADVLYAPIYDLGGQTLPPGVYKDPSSFGITGTLTLNGGGDPYAVWIFQAGSTLITATRSSVVLTGDAQACNVFWQVGSSATLGSYSDFAGNILALTDITLDPYATVVGRVLAQNGAVTLSGYNTITKQDCTYSGGGGGGGGGTSVPDPGSTLLLLGSGLAALFAVKRRFNSPA